MFKSVFAKYISAFMCIILACFVLIIGIITAIVRNYSVSAKEDIMETAAKSSSTYLSSKLEATSATNLQHLVANYEKDIETMLTVVSSNTDDMTVIIVENDGKIIFSAGSGKKDILNNATMPKSLMDEVNSGNVIKQSGRIYGVFESPQFVSRCRFIISTALSAARFSYAQPRLWSPICLRLLSKR